MKTTLNQSLKSSTFSQHTSAVDIFCLLLRGLGVKVLSLMVVLFVCGGVVGQTDLYWDANGATAGTGGTGTWNTAGTWRSGSVTGTLGNWVDGSNAIFQGTAGTVTIPTTTTITTNNITFSTTGYIVTGATSSGKLSLSTTNKTITVGSGVVAKIGTYAASSLGNAVLAGTGGMTIDGSGELILAAGLQSSLSGGVTVTGNSILTCGDRNNSTPILNGANSSAGFFGGNALVLNNGTLRLAAAAAAGFVLSGLNGISVSASSTGTFDIWRTATATSTSPNLTTNSTATVAMGSNSTLAVVIGGGTANAGNITFGNLTASGNFTLKGPQVGYPGMRFGTINDGGFQMTLLGGGTSSLAGVNPINSYTIAGSSFTGSLVLGNSGGTEGAQYIPASLATTDITTGNITVYPNSQLSHALAGNFGNAASTLTLYGNGLANTGGAITTTNAGTTTWLGATVLGANTTITPGASNILVLNGNFSGAFQLTKSGAGTLTLNGTNASNTSSTVITNGTVTVNSGSSLGTGALAMSQSTGVNTALNLNQSQSVSSLSSSFTNTTTTFTQVITIASGKTLTINQSTNTTYGVGSVATLSSTIAGAGNLIKSGAGSLTFTSVNAHTGSTTINGGTLALSGSGSIATSPTITVGSSGTLDVSGLTSALTLGVSQTLIGSATGSNTTGTIKVASSKNLTLSAGGLTFTALAATTTPPLTVDGTSGNLVLVSGCAITVPNNLTAGTYKLIAKSGNGATVSGTAGTINYSGSVNNTSASLALSSGELILTVVSSITEPLAPTMGTITPGNQQLSVSFTAGNDGGSAITNYKYSTDGGTNFTSCSPAQTTSPIVIIGLTNGTSYNVQIKAVNGIGDGAATASSAATPATTPSAPSITSITPGNQELSVAFTAGATGGAVISNYKYSTDGGSSFTAVSPASTTSPITITSLTNGTTYDVQIKAVNAQGDGIATATTQGTPSAASVAPGAPTITSITPSNGQLSVAFTTGATGGSAITNYKYSTDGGGTFTAVTPSATTSPITISGLINGTSYNVQIKAVNIIGDGTPSGTTVGAPGTTPSAPSITGITAGNTQLSVAFTAGATGGSSITNYKYSTDGGSTFTALSPPAITSPITITGLSNGTSYNIQIKAVNAIGDGIATASSVGTPATTSSAPTIGTATAGNGQATVTFTAPASNGGSTITSYTATSIPGSITGTLNQAGSGTITVTGLTNGTAYTFTVKANNAAGASTASAASNSVTPILSAPVANAATNVLTNGFTANWDAVTGASSGYLLDVSTSATFETTALATDLFISEYVEGSASNKYIEIFNGTGATVDLSFYELGLAANGNTPSYSTMTGNLANGSTIVYQNSAATLTLPAGVTAISNGAVNFNGDDAVVLHKVVDAAATFVDVFGRVGNDPGTSWSSTSNSTVDKTLTRKSTIISGITSSPTGTGSGAFTTLETEWNQSNIDVVSGLGSHSISVIQPSFVTGYNAKPISGQATVSSVVTGLSENTTYYYRLRATDGSTSSNSNVITVTTKQTPIVTPTVGTYTYTGSAQGPNAATNTGTGTSYTFSYSGTGSTTYGPSSNQPTAAGTYTVTASVAADGNYVAASSSATAFSIAKATPTITTAPTATNIFLGQALSTSTLSGGTASPAGTFTFTSPSTVPGSTGNYSASVTYTPTDGANYNTATTNVSLQVVQSLSTFSNTQFTTARNITRNTTELPIYRFQVDVTNTSATLSSLGFTTPATAANGNSNYVNTDITNFKAFLTTSTTFSNSTQLGSTSPSGKTQQNAGETLIDFTSLATTLNIGTYYIWLTADVLSGAVTGRTIIVNAPTISITGAVSGTNSATGTQTIISVATNYYLNAGGGLTTSANYYTSPNGVGTTLSAAGLTYTSNDIILNIPVSVTNTSDFTLGNGSKIVVQNGGSLTVGSSNTITGTIDVNDGGTLTVNNTSILHTLGTLGSSSSTVVYNASGAQTVATKNYSNLSISGGNTKTLGGATAVSGTLAINGTVLALGSNNLSPANLTLDGSGTRNGTWGSTASTATYKNNTYFSGLGVATVTNNTALSPSISGVTASQSITYGDPSITLTGTVSATGPVYPANGETVSVTINGNTQTTTTTGGNGSFSITYTCNTIPYSATPYTITYAYAGNGFWNPANNATSTLTINKATLTVTADDKSKTYDGAIYSGGYTSSLTGFVNNETVSVIGGAAAYGGTAISATSAGSYSISPVVGTLVASNYTFSFSDGTLTINKATPTLSISNSPQIYTGSTIAATVSGSVAGTVSNVKYDGSSTVPTNAGTYAVTANLVPTDGTNYNSLTDVSAGNFAISKVTPTLSISNSPQTYTGSAIAATVNGSVPGTISNVKYDGSLTVPTNAGTYAVTANLVPTDATNYNSLTDVSAGNYVINKAAQSITFTSTNSVFNSVADYDPGATSATSGINAITYTSSNLSVATIISGNIHVTGVGQTTITASQASSTNYNAANATQTLTVVAYTSISTQPSGYTILATNANPTALTVTAIGTNLSYQWYSNTANSTSNGTSINSATSAAYTPPTTLGAMYYYVVVHGDYGSDVTSNVVAVVISDNFTWNGSTSTDWNTASNWTPAGVPIATAIVSVPNCTNDPVIGNLNISSAGSVTLATGTMLTLSGIISNNGTLTIENGATLVQTGTGNNSGNGTYNVKQDITGSGGSSPNGRFWYLGSPLSNGLSTALLSSTGNLLWQWNESSFAYAPVTSGQTLTQGKSYVLRSGQTSETLNFSGTGLSNGTVTVPNLTRTGTTQQFRGCHLVSNPFPSYLDWDLVDKTYVSTTMYVRTASNSSIDVLETYNSYNGQGTSISGPAMTQYIAPMQGFWVKVSADNLTGSLTMNNSMRSHQPTGSGLRSTPQDFPAFLRFNMLDGQNKDQVILLMSPDASMSLDNFDSEKMSASGYAQFYSTVNATKLVINGMKNVKAKTSVPLTLVMPTSKSYTFQAEEFNIEDGLILLEDKQEGVIQDLTINPTYSFFGNAGTNATRFVVHFQLATAPVLVGGPQELESLGSDELTTDNIQIVSNNQGTVIVRLDEGFKPEGSIRIFDASGRLVEQTDFNDQETTIHLNEQAGMYFVEVSAGKLMVKKKIVIQ